MVHAGEVGVRQYKYRCCGHVVSKIYTEERCHFCGTVNPVLEEVDKEDQVLLNVGGYSGDQERETRPWGSFRVVLDEPNVKVKKITVKPKQRLSLQLHEHRNEWWKVITGTGEMQVGNSMFKISAWDTVEIEKYQVHRVENIGDVDLIFVEIQTGVCNEDDIIRIRDDYNRAGDNS
jgi:mannose-6-phosphate isomerase-like protein (cupin superfamily)